MAEIAVAIFIATYLGMAAGQVPGLKLDRSGIALIGAIALIAIDAVTPAQAVNFIDRPTIMLLFGLMIVAAQFGIAGVFEAIARRIAELADRPHRLLAAVIVVSGILSAGLANDIIVFAMTPLLCTGLRVRKIDPVPYLIALAASANAGSAATLIGNPQNILIGQMAGLGFWRYAAVALPVSVMALVIVYGVIAWLWRAQFAVNVPVHDALHNHAPLPLDQRQYQKGLLATVVLLALFATPVPREVSTLAVAGVLLLSRRVHSRTLVSAVDWNLLIMFIGLFVVTGTFLAQIQGGAGSGDIAARATAQGWLPDRLSILVPMALAISNTIGNVPAVMLILRAWPSPPEGAMTALAILSTLAGNLLLLGSIANIIVAERAQAAGVRLGFMDHARAGNPITLLSTAAAAGWLLALKLIRF
jgi:Na+/H+ antiporter NhaD/arsenite permease-like protein